MRSFSSFFQQSVKKSIPQKSQKDKTQNISLINWQLKFNDIC
jgi:hypothetical protein